MRLKREYEYLNHMLDEAIAGQFGETVYDESELSKLQMKWNRYLSAKNLEEKKLAQEHENLKQLITNISHQTKTPLTNILLYAQLLEERIPEGQERMYVEEILTYAGKLEILLEAMVKMSRMETGVFSYTKKKRPLYELADMAVRMATAKAAEKEISIRCVYDRTQMQAADEKVIYAQYDSKWSCEAVYNILDNAIKYADCGTEITVRIRGYELFSCIEISDLGPGIAEEEIPRIFGRFYRGSNVHDKEGIGVGLYLSRAIVEGQDGYIKVISQPKEGSTFQIFLPV